MRMRHVEASSNRTDIMNIDLRGKHAVVTGSTGGIGFAIAKGLTASGASVVINGRTEDRVQQAVALLRKELPSAKVEGVAADLANAEAVAAFVKRVPAADILVNNLGIFEPKNFEDIPDEDWFRFFETNVLSGIRMSRAYIPGMKAKDWGRIVFISSESGLNIPLEMIHYGMTKTAQIAVARGLAESLAGTGVTVNSVLPGPTRSEGVVDFFGKMAKEQGVSHAQMEQDFIAQHRPTSIIRRLATVDEVANMVVYACSKEASATTRCGVAGRGRIVARDRLDRRALRLRAAQVLIQPRHDLDEVARPVAVIELVREDAVPAILAGAGRARQAEDVSRTGNARGCAGLDRRGADLGVADHQEQGREPIHPLFEQRLDRFGGDVAASEAGAAGGDHDIDAFVGDPRFHLRTDVLNIVGNDRARGELVPGGFKPLHQRRAGLVVRHLAGVGDGQDRNVERDEISRFVDAGHYDYSCAARNVSQSATRPDSSPRLNQRTRCSAEPWVNESGTTRPVDCFCSRSSPIADAIPIAPSMSPGSMKSFFRRA
jgi:NAD(P)-dependent dehydrogenase (short-subunit alcohol dehydrogenase family)